MAFGATLLRSGSSYEEAVDVLRAALAEQPRHVDGLRSLQLALSRHAPVGDAVDAWSSLGLALDTQDCFEDAIQAYHRAIERQPHCLKALTHVARAHAARGEPAAAVGRLRTALAIDPDNAFVHTWLGRVLHLTGDLERGLTELGWFCHPRGLRWRVFEQPIWDGTPIGGRTILLWADQVLGDTIHFLRYALIVRSAGARVILECSPRLVPLIPSWVRPDDVVARGAPLPAFDLHAPLTLLPMVIRGVRWPHRADVPYLSVDCSLVRYWRRRLKESCRGHTETTVGLSWVGHPEGTARRARFMPLTAVAPLAHLPGVRFVSLQMGPESGQLPPPGLCLDRPQDERSTLQDTAALVSSLDLVVTVDTMIAHLAGALGRPVWMVLPYAADWRWLTGPDASPWYPTMRLFRQRRAGDWTDVFERVRSALVLRGSVSGTALQDAGPRRAVLTS